MRRSTYLKSFRVLTLSCPWAAPTIGTRFKLRAGFESSSARGEVRIVHTFHETSDLWGGAGFPHEGGDLLLYPADATWGYFDCQNTTLHIA